MNKAHLNKFTDFWYLLSFLILSIIVITPFIHYGKVFVISDWSFHANRVEQIYRNLRLGKAFTFIATSTFNHTGVGSFLFYPTLFLYPWALLRFIFNPVVSFYLWYALITMLAFIVSFYSMRKYVNDDKTSFVFSLIYVLNTYRLYLGHAVFGEFIAASFLPLVFLGFYQVFFGKNTRQARITLAVGMALVTYAHILSLVLIAEVFLVILVGACILGKYRQVFSRWKEVLKSIGLWGLLTAPIIYLFCYAYIGRQITSAYFGIALVLTPTLQDLIKNSVKGVDIFGGGVLPYGIGTVLIVTALVGWYQARRTRRDMWTYLLGLGMLVLASSTFPWKSLRMSPLAVVQLPFRYLNFASLFLAIIAAKLVVRLLGNTKLSQKMIVLLGTLLAVISFAWAEKVYIRNARTVPVAQISDKPVMHPMPIVYLNKDNYNRQFNYQVLYGETDYYPSVALKNAGSIVSQQAFINGRPIPVTSVGKANEIMIRASLDKSGMLDLPIVVYHGTQVKVNGRKVKTIISKRGTVQTKLPKGGRYKIKVRYNPGLGFYLAVIVALCASGVLVWESIHNLRIKLEK